MSRSVTIYHIDIFIKTSLNRPVGEARRALPEGSVDIESVRYQLAVKADNCRVGRDRCLLLHPPHHHLLCQSDSRLGSSSGSSSSSSWIRLGNISRVSLAVVKQQHWYSLLASWYIWYVNSVEGVVPPCRHSNPADGAGFALGPDARLPCDNATDADITIVFRFPSSS
ncbi:hypothetical protein Tco_0749095 [Tanacetum coccineum]|uniref:Uncharacterized protein n=1 Tax=Tanacetum coccineum TaxID=301880 RepID=A0ABQ4YXG8_9ASTR